MATNDRTNEAVAVLPDDEGPDHTSDGRPIFKTREYDGISVEARGAIRILKVHPGEPEQHEVRCELIPGTILRDKDRLPGESSLVKFVPYDALSWCWGKEESDAWISIMKEETSYVKYVQPGLAAALRALRHGTYARYLWVDAICINQKYKPEKNACPPHHTVQVEMMAEIYGRADCVRIWLGDSDSSSDLAILFIKQQILQLQHFDDLSSNKDNSDNWKALLELMSRPWFSRRWVIQEVTLARRSVIHCGRAKLAWTKFAIAVELFVEVETATHRLSEVMKTDAKYHHVPRWFEYISQLGASLLVDATGKLFRDYDYIEKGSLHQNSDTRRAFGRPQMLLKDDDQLSYESEDEEVVSPSERAERYEKDEARQSVGTKGQPLLTLEYLVSSMSIFDVTNRHDSIYALLGIAKDTTPTAVGKSLRVTDHTRSALEMFTARKHYPVDYSAHYIDICKEFIQFCIRQNRKRDPSRALDVICRPWAIEMTESDGEPPLPSWLPRLSKASYGMVLEPGIDGMRMGRMNADSLVGLPNVTHRNYNAAETKGLDTRTFRFRSRDTRPKASAEETALSVSNDASPSTGNLSRSAPMEPVRASVSVCTDGTTGNTAKSNGTTASTPRDEPLNHLSLYVKGFVLDTIASKQPSSQSGSIPTSWASFAGWNMESTPPEYFWRTLVADRGSHGQNPPVYYSRACQESFRKGGTKQGVVNTTGLIEHERNSVVAQFCRRVQAAIWNRALIKTRNGRFGLVPSYVKEEDLVCILYGCSVPVVLRKQGPKSSQVVASEREAELQHIANYVVDSCRSHLKRRKMFRDQRQADKLLFEKWEREKYAQFQADAEWTARWGLVQESLVRIHCFRAWVMKKHSPELSMAGHSDEADKAVHTMRDTIQNWLYQIYDIADWAGPREATEITIIDHLRRFANDENTPKSFGMTEDQLQLFDRFAQDQVWERWWEEENKAYLEEEGFKAWASATGRVIGYKTEELRAREEWKAAKNDEWKRRWAASNSWYLCIDPFKAWLREKGKFHGSEEVLDYKQEWEGDTDWHSNRPRQESERVSFGLWMSAKGRKNPELIAAKAGGHTTEEMEQYKLWMPDWLRDHPDADPHSLYQAWIAEKDRRNTQLEDERKSKQEERAKRLDKEPFLERWRKGWRPEKVNWGEFELALRYGRHWIDIVKRHKRNHLNEQEDLWNSDAVHLQRQRARAFCINAKYGKYPTPSTGKPRTNGGSHQQRRSSLERPTIDIDSRSKATARPSKPRKPSDLKSPTNGAPRHTETVVAAMEKPKTNGELRNETSGKGKATPEGEETRELEEKLSTVLSKEAAQQTAQTYGDVNSAAVVTEHPHEDEDRPRTRDDLEPNGETRGPNSVLSDPSVPVLNDKPESQLMTTSKRESFPPSAGLNRQKSYAERIAQESEEQKKEWQAAHETLMNEGFESQASLKNMIEMKKARFPLHWDYTKTQVNQSYDEWVRITPKIRGIDGKYYLDLSRRKLLVPPPDKKENREERTERRNAAALEATRRADCLHPRGYWIRSKVRATLTDENATAWMAKVRETFEQRTGDDAKWYYEMLGECYIHGMMDGEAMKHQNDEGISSQVFEIR